MLIYEKNKKLYGTLARAPAKTDDEVIYRDADDKTVTLNENDKYVDNKTGGIIRKSDNKQVNVFIDDTRVVPNGKYNIKVEHTTPVKVGEDYEYLYDITYSSYGRNLATEYYKKKINQLKHGACTSVRSGNWVGRNLDWYYDNAAGFIIRVTAEGKRHASVAFADGITPLTKAVVDAYIAGGDRPEQFDFLPYATTDGVNDCGVYVNSNIVTLDYGTIDNTNPGKPDMFVLNVSRYILDNYSTATDAVKMFDKFNLFGMSFLGEEPHWMICDPTSTFIVEFINNKVHIMSDQDDEYDNIPNKETPIMTNFNLTGWNGQSKLVWRGDTPEEVKATGIQDHAMGIERYDLMKSNYAPCNSYEDMRSLIDRVAYTKMYSLIGDNLEDSAIWRTENVGNYPDWGGDLTVYTTMEGWKPVLIHNKEVWQSFTREPSSGWQTTHCSIYDLQNKKFYVRTQELSPGHEWTTRTPHEVSLGE